MNVVKKLSAADTAEIERLAALGDSLREIAASIGVSDRTLRRRLEDTPEITEAFERGRRAGIVTIENKLYEQCLNGNTTAIIYYLKCRAPEKWSDRQRVDLTSGGSPVQIQIINDLKD